MKRFICLFLLVVVLIGFVSSAEGIGEEQKGFWSKFSDWFSGVFGFGSVQYNGEGQANLAGEGAGGVVSEESLSGWGYVSDGVEGVEIFGDEGPKVSLIGPAEGEVVDGRFVVLRYAVENFRNVKECKLYSDSFGNSFEDSPDWMIGGFNSEPIDVFLEFVFDGTYGWGVICEDFLGNKNEIERRSFSVENIEEVEEDFIVKIIPDVSEEMVNYVITDRDVDFIYMKELEESLEFEKLELLNSEGDVYFSKEFSDFQCGNSSEGGNDVVYCNYPSFSLDPNNFLEDGFVLGNEGVVTYVLYYTLDGEEMIEESEILIKVVEGHNNEFGQ